MKRWISGPEQRIGGSCKYLIPKRCILGNGNVNVHTKAPSDAKRFAAIFLRASLGSEFKSCSMVASKTFS
jgi:hypothetical protein